MKDFFALFDVLFSLKGLVIMVESLGIFKTCFFKKYIWLRRFPFVKSQGNVRTWIIYLLDVLIWEAYTCDDLVRDDNKGIDLNINCNICFKILVYLAFFCNIFISVNIQTSNMEIRWESPAISLWSSRWCQLQQGFAVAHQVCTLFTIAWRKTFNAILKKSLYWWFGTFKINRKIKRNSLINIRGVVIILSSLCCRLLNSHLSCLSEIHRIIRFLYSCKLVLVCSNWPIFWLWCRSFLLLFLFSWLFLFHLF